MMCWQSIGQLGQGKRIRLFNQSIIISVNLYANGDICVMKWDEFPKLWLMQGSPIHQLADNVIMLTDIFSSYRQCPLGDAFDIWVPGDYWITKRKSISYRDFNNDLF